MDDKRMTRPEKRGVTPEVEQQLSWVNQEADHSLPPGDMGNVNITTNHHPTLHQEWRPMTPDDTMDLQALTDPARGMGQHD